MGAAQQWQIRCEARRWRVTAALLCAALLFGRWAGGEPDARSSPMQTSSQASGVYAGDAACLQCHRDKVLTYKTTVHSLTSQIASKDSVLGSFQKGANILMIADPAKATENPGLYFRMDERDGGFYETAVAGWPNAYTERSGRIDIVIGSGVRGQSYLSWRGDELYELPVSYWTDGHRWINSPGYQDGTMDFSRPVPPRCLECHSTFIRQLSANPLSNRYDRATLRVGIQCETCHGPGEVHVRRETEIRSGVTTNLKAGIINPGRLSRDRQVDLCALCHNGIRSQELARAFSFTPGADLNNFLRPDPADAAEAPNVHGNQVGLLKKSRCYLSSPNMSCSTCHDVHAPEQSAASYSSRCMLCHQVSSCGMSRKLGKRIADNCIDCHMPVQVTSAVVSETAGERIRPRLRSHWIRIYVNSSPP